MKTWIHLVLAAVMAIAGSWVARKSFPSPQTGSSVITTPGPGRAESLSPAEEAELQRLHKENQGIHALRVEVPELRKQLKQLERLEQGLTTLLQQREKDGGKFLREDQRPGYRAQNSWQNRGNASPEASLETLFWAIRERNPKGLASVILLSEEQQDRLAEELKNIDLPQARSGLADSTKRIPPGFRVVQPFEAYGPNKMKGIVLVLEQEKNAIFVREGNSWKLDPEESDFSM